MHMQGQHSTVYTCRKSCWVTKTKASAQCHKIGLLLCAEPLRRCLHLLAAAAGYVSVLAACSGRFQSKGGSVLIPHQTHLNGTWGHLHGHHSSIW